MVVRFDHATVLVVIGDCIDALLIAMIAMVDISN
jgi:hypothetical protein